MRAFVVTDYAHPSKIPVTQNAPEPKAGPGQVLVDIYSAGLNYFDVRMRRHVFLLASLASSVLTMHLHLTDSAIPGQVPAPAAAPIRARQRARRADRGGLADPRWVPVQAGRQGVRGCAGRIRGEGCCELAGSRVAAG